MNQEYFEDKSFEKIDFWNTVMIPWNYERCIFDRCNFSKTDISRIHFSECEFRGCDMSMTKIIETEFMDATFIDSKLLWLAFENCSSFLLSVSFDNCILDFSSFRGLKIKNTIFKNSNLNEVNFIETDLTGSCFMNCDLTRAIFEKSVLENVDFRTSYNFIIDPEINKLKKAKFSLSGIPWLLYKYNISIQ